MVLAAVAMVNAVYLSYKAYYVRYIDPVGLSSFCDFSATASCTEVLRHPLSQVFAISFPWVALGVYPVLIILAWSGYRKPSYVKAKTLAILSFLGMCFNGFIIYRELFFIKAYCLLCLLCTAIIVSIFCLSIRLLREDHLLNLERVSKD